MVIFQFANCWFTRPGIGCIYRGLYSPIYWASNPWGEFLSTQVLEGRHRVLDTSDLISSHLFLANERWFTIEWAQDEMKGYTYFIWRTLKWPRQFSQFSQFSIESPLNLWICSFFGSKTDFARRVRSTSGDCVRSAGGPFIRSQV